jgi:hypothetical protein
MNDENLTNLAKAVAADLSTTEARIDYLEERVQEMDQAWQKLVDTLNTLCPTEPRGPAGPLLEWDASLCAQSGMRKYRLVPFNEPLPYWRATVNVTAGALPVDGIGATVWSHEYKEVGRGPLDSVIQDCVAHERAEQEREGANA